MQQLDLFDWQPPEPVPPDAARLINVLVGGARKTLGSTEHSHTHNYAETLLYIQVGKLLNCEINEFCDRLRHWMHVTKAGNNLFFWNLYVVNQINTSTVEIWHTSHDGDPDR